MDQVLVPHSPTLPRVLCDFYKTFRGFTLRGKSPYQGHFSSVKRSYVIKVNKKDRKKGNTHKKEGKRWKERKRDQNMVLNLLRYHHHDKKKYMC